MKHSVGMKDIVPARSKPLTTVRTLLLWMMLVGFVPSLAGVGFLVHRQYQDGRAQLAINTIQTARAMVQAVDAQLAQGEILALTLASSDSLRKRDFAAFHQRALRLISESSFVQSVLIYDRNGVPLVNTRLPYGQVLPRRSDMEQIQTVFEGVKPAKPGLMLSPLTHEPVISIAVPVVAGGKVEYVLAMGIAPYVFSRILAKQNLSQSWVAGVVDDSGTIVARTHAPESFVGKKAGLVMLQQLALAPEGSTELTTLEGIQTVAPYSRSVQSGWSVIIGIPRDALEAQLRHSLLILCAGAILILWLSTTSVWFFGRRFTAAAVVLRVLAQALGNGTRSDVPKMQISEAQEVAQSMVSASHALSNRANALAASHEMLIVREAELADAQRIAKIGSWSWDVQSDQSWSSQEMCRIFGFKEIPSFAQQDGLMFTHDTWQQLRSARLTMAHNGQGYNLELPAMRADATPIWVNSRAEVIRNSVGEITGLRGMVQDITDRKHAEMAMLQSEMRYRTLVEDSPEAITVQRNGQILFANKACVRMFGASVASDIVGRSVIDFVHSEFHQSTLARMQSISDFGELVPTTELKLIKMDGAVMNGEAQGTTVLFDGAPAIQIYLRDTTERKRQSRELSELRTEMQTMMEWQVARHTVAALAHEINQPLATVAVLCEAANRMLVIDGLPGELSVERPKRLEQTLQRMASETERAGIVIRQLMKSVQQPDVTLQPTVLSALLNDAAQMLLGEGSFDCQIHIRCPDHLKPIHVNQLQITKVLLNLLGNAAQAMQFARIATGDIWLTAMVVQDGAMVDVSVRDSGPGIAANRMTEIFQAFVSTKSDGLGMGLAISRALVEAHGGKLWLEVNTGPGATFHFTLPTSS